MWMETELMLFKDATWWPKLILAIISQLVAKFYVNIDFFS